MPSSCRSGRPNRGGSRGRKADPRALGLGDRIGNLAPGFDADFIVLDDQATPLLARRTAAAERLDEWLFGMIVLADDRAVVAAHAAGRDVTARATG